MNQKICEIAGLAMEMKFSSRLLVVTLGLLLIGCRGMQRRGKIIQMWLDGDDSIHVDCLSGLFRHIST
jgi:hypothetical protein